MRNGRDDPDATRDARPSPPPGWGPGRDPDGGESTVRRPAAAPAAAPAAEPDSDVQPDARGTRLYGGDEAETGPSPFGRTPPDTPSSSTEIPAPPSVIAPGVELFGKYTVLRKLGEGGMGEVWLVRHLGLDAERALKTISSALTIHPEVRARFRREGRAMARFTHPNAVAVHDAGSAGATHYIEMEYIPGQSLNKKLVRGVPMPLDWTAHILGQLCEVLQVAHDHHIIHRDLKPSNLMLVDGPGGPDRLKVLDFGVAKILKAAHRDPDDPVTQGGALMGTLEYMSPEQAGAGPVVDHRSDLYSVGVILYELLTGYRPFDSQGHKLIHDVLVARPPRFAARNPAVKVPRGVEKLVMRCLEKEPEKRPGSARELAEEFRRVAGLTPEASPDAAPARPGRRKRVAVAAALLLLPLLGLGAFGARGWFRPPSLPVRVPASIRLRAGGSAVLTVAAGDTASPASVAPGDVPEGVVVTPRPEAGTDVDRVFSVAAELNLTPVPARRSLTFVATAGRLRREVTVALTIDPPDVELPPGFARAEGSRLVTRSGQVYADRIERRFPDGTSAVFLLIPKRGRDEPDDFYVLRDKVWVGLFRQFARESPGAAAGWPDPGPEADPRLPAVRVSGPEAEAFAAWLGGGRGRLPAADEWDQAAGANLPGHGPGPFRGEWDPAEPARIALRRGPLGPLPVGSSADDVSPLGCTDMAGNGWEWTRPSSADEDFVELRSQRYDSVQSDPYRYHPDTPDAERFRSRSLLIGFRTVIPADATP